MVRSLFLPTNGVMHIPDHGTNVVRMNCYLNHSTAPNMRTRDGYVFTALRKIMAGEELTVDYRTYGADALLPAMVNETDSIELPNHNNTRTSSS